MSSATLEDRQEFTVKDLPNTWGEFSHFVTRFMNDPRRTEVAGRYDPDKPESVKVYETLQGVERRLLALLAAPHVDDERLPTEVKTGTREAMACLMGNNGSGRSWGREAVFNGVGNGLRAGMRFVGLRQ